MVPGYIFPSLHSQFSLHLITPPPRRSTQAPKELGSEQLTIQMPAACTGGATGDKCLVSFKTASGFGNCVVVQNAASGSVSNSTDTGDDTDTDSTDDSDDSTDTDTDSTSTSTDSSSTAVDTSAAEAATSVASAAATGSAAAAASSVAAAAATGKTSAKAAKGKNTVQVGFYFALCEMCRLTVTWGNDITASPRCSSEPHAPPSRGPLPPLGCLAREQLEGDAPFILSI